MISLIPFSLAKTVLFRSVAVIPSYHHTVLSLSRIRFSSSFSLIFDLLSGSFLGMFSSMALGLFNVVVNIKKVIRRKAKSTIGVKSTLVDSFFDRFLPCFFLLPPSEVFISAILGVSYCSSVVAVEFAFSELPESVVIRLNLLRPAFSVSAQITCLTALILLFLSPLIATFIVGS